MSDSKATSEAASGTNPIVNLQRIPLEPGPSRGRFRSRVGRAAKRAGGEKIGLNVFEVEPGCTAFPYHWHAVVEESILIVEGEGTLRLGGETYSVGPGDYIALPTGPEHAHQLVNTGAGVLRYYCFSTQASTEVCGYPDSRKIGVFVDMGEAPRYRALYLEDDKRDYFEGEALASEAASEESSSSR